MAKKKKSGHKKHSFAAKATGGGAKISSAVATPEVSTAKAPKPATLQAEPVATSGASLAVVHPAIFSDVRRSLSLAISLATAQALLWFLFTHTGLGSYIYGLVRL